MHGTAIKIRPDIYKSSNQGKGTPLSSYTWSQERKTVIVNNIYLSILSVLTLKYTSGDKPSENPKTIIQLQIL